jgi:hypothetical protein
MICSRCLGAHATRACGYDAVEARAVHAARLAARPALARYVAAQARQGAQTEGAGRVVADEATGRLVTSRGSTSSPRGFRNGRMPISRPGRRRRHPTNADRQRAYRERLKTAQLADRDAGLASLAARPDPGLEKS